MYAPLGLRMPTLWGMSQIVCAVDVSAAGCSRSRRQPLTRRRRRKKRLQPLHRHRRDKTPAYPVPGSLSAAAYKRRCIFGHQAKASKELVVPLFHAPHFRPLLSVSGSWANVPIEVMVFILYSDEITIDVKTGLVTRHQNKIIKPKGFIESLTLCNIVMIT
jgi:hypothetical protein